MVLYTILLEEKFLLVILTGIIPIAIDGIGQLFGLWESTNAIRAITGILAGIVCGVALGVIRDEIASTRLFERINIFQKKS